MFVNVYVYVICGIGNCRVSGLKTKEEKEEKVEGIGAFLRLRSSLCFGLSFHLSLSLSLRSFFLSSFKFFVDYFTFYLCFGQVLCAQCAVWCCLN